MPRYLIEVPHEGGVQACNRAAKLLLEHGSHFVTNADFGCHDNVHKAWIIIEADTKDGARYMLPPDYRPQAIITGLNKFRLEEIDRLTELHT
ncbi:MAG: hypothetical protein HYY50_00110 [Candidatus Kerfeldbacteria bacterium]|nr:hypothetical protein [Candidatus Kerfeldbacteria bacterium]